MQKWEAITGIILLVVGLWVFAQNYHTQAVCNSLGGKISTFFNSLFGGNSVQACYNSMLSEIGGIIVALIGLVVLVFAFKTGSAPRRRK